MTTASLLEPRVVRVRIARPRPSPRLVADDLERDTALDFEVQIDVAGQCFEGSVTLHNPPPGERWLPCRSTPWGGERGWVHGGLAAGVQRAKELAETEADASRVEHTLVAALSGEDWPDDARPRSAWLRARTWAEQLEVTRVIAINAETA